MSSCQPPAFAWRSRECAPDIHKVSPLRGEHHAALDSDVDDDEVSDDDLESAGSECRLLECTTVPGDEKGDARSTDSSSKSPWTVGDICNVTGLGVHAPVKAKLDNSSAAGSVAKLMREGVTNDDDSRLIEDNCVNGWCTAVPPTLATGGSNI